MATPKTKPANIRGADFMASIGDPAKRRDCRRIAGIMRAATGCRAKVWGTSMVGFGSYSYTYASGHSGSWFEVGFSPRARNITIYIMPGFSPYKALMKKLGRYKTGKSCLYIQKLDDVDVDVLTEIIDSSVVEMRKRYPANPA